MSEYKVKRSIVLKTKEKTAVLTPIEHQSAFIVTVASEEKSISGRVHVNELVSLLTTSVQSK